MTTVKPTNPASQHESSHNQTLSVRETAWSHVAGKKLSGVILVRAVSSAQTAPSDLLTCIFNLEVKKEVLKVLFGRASTVWQIAMQVQICTQQADTKTLQAGFAEAAKAARRHIDAEMQPPQTANKQHLPCIYLSLDFKIHDATSSLASIKDWVFNQEFERNENLTSKTTLDLGNQMNLMFSTTAPSHDGRLRFFCSPFIADTRQSRKLTLEFTSDGLKTAELKVGISYNQTTQEWLLDRVFYKGSGEIGPSATEAIKEAVHRFFTLSSLGSYPHSNKIFLYFTAPGGPPPTVEILGGLLGIKGTPSKTSLQRALGDTCTVEEHTFRMRAVVGHALVLQPLQPHSRPIADQHAPPTH